MTGKRGMTALKGFSARDTPPSLKNFLGEMQMWLYQPHTSNASISPLRKILVGYLIFLPFARN
jgi:hypothetical protein